jgi:hypothetical protein
MFAGANVTTMEQVPPCGSTTVFSKHVLVFVPVAIVNGVPVAVSAGAAEIVAG